jgi:hypothetical protein
MGFYRIYRLDSVSCFTTAEEIEAESDGEALDKASMLHGGFRREVWQRDRLVGTIEISTPSPDQT